MAETLATVLQLRQSSSGYKTYLPQAHCGAIGTSLYRSNKRLAGKWKSWNPKYWEERYGLVDISVSYYQMRKQLYAALFEHSINTMA
jgi:hypothetical protein